MHNKTHWFPYAISHTETFHICGSLFDGRWRPLFWHLLMHWAFFVFCFLSFFFCASVALSVSSWSRIKGWWRTRWGQKPTRPASRGGKHAVYIIDYYRDKQAYLSKMMCAYILFDTKRSPGNGECWGYGLLVVYHVIMSTIYQENNLLLQ